MKTTLMYGLIGLVFGSVAMAQKPAERTRMREINLDSVDVVAVGAIPGTTLNRQRVAVNVQTARARQIERSQSTDLTDFMNRNLGSVHLNTPGGNPLEPDLSFRGFQASPLLGTPQGVAVYQDGVRVNELFGDIVSWDMVPKTAVAGLTFSSGSNPMFGLNALGGALALQMKSGFSDARLRVSGYGGSFGRFNAEVSSGGLIGRKPASQSAQWAYFVAGQHFRETGWRDHSPSQASLLYGKLSRQGRRSLVDLSVSGGRSRLLGNGPLPDEALAVLPKAVFTHPDRTDNRLGLLTAQYGYTLRKDVRLNVVAYAKDKRTATLNGDLTTYRATAEGYLIQDNDGDESDDDDEDHGRESRIKDQTGAFVRATPAVSSAVNNSTETRQRGYGTSVQIAIDKPVLTRENHLVAGVSYDGGAVFFTSVTELGQLTEDRGTIGSGLYDAGSAVDVHIRVQHKSVYVQETLVPAEKLTVSLAGRLNESTVVLMDQLGDALNGSHRFSQFNPAAGVVYAMSQQLNAYASYSLSNRTPTPVELTCADPSAPCRLPNSFLSDPPLKQVVARTWEAGLRGQYRSWEWSAGLFRTRLQNDILFVSAGPARNSGYFTNIGGTQRQGLEAMLRKSRGPWRGLVSYTYQQATFREDLTLSSPHHPLAVEGEIQGKAGNRLPLTPAHLLKVSAEADALRQRLTLGADWVLNGPQYLRGDDLNALAPLPTYAVLSLRAQWDINRHWAVFGRVSNVLNDTYRSFGLLGPVQNLAGLPATESPRWLTPGVPRQAQAGLTWRL